MEEDKTSEKVSRTGMASKTGMAFRTGIGSTEKMIGRYLVNNRHLFLNHNVNIDISDIHSSDNFRDNRSFDRRRDFEPRDFERRSEAREDGWRQGGRAEGSWKRDGSRDGPRQPVANRRRGELLVLRFNVNSFMQQSDYFISC